MVAISKQKNRQRNKYKKKHELYVMVPFFFSS